LVELCMSKQCRCIFTMFTPATFFYYKSVFSQFRLGGSWKFFCKIRWVTELIGPSKDGSPNLLAKFVIYLQPTLAVTLWPVPNIQ
jgi:uncharacterized membrane protein